MNYDELSKAVNKRYEELMTTETPKDAIGIIKSEFQLSTTVVWEFLGVKDELDFNQNK